MHKLFVTLLLFCEPTYPERLWKKHFLLLTDDILIQAQHHGNNLALVLSDEDIENRALNHMESILHQHGKGLKDFPNMPLPSALPGSTYSNRLIQEEQQYDFLALAQQAIIGQSQLNSDQQVIFNAVTQAVKDGIPAAFFVDGPGGTGKTFLYKVLLDKVRADGNIALAVASSGIAALLLSGGRTAHSRFKIPINLHEDSTCSISYRSDLASLLQQAHLIIWDEASMMHRYAFQAVDRTLRDLMKANHPESEDKVFGGKVIVFGGDFRQVLPVIPKGGRDEIVKACLQYSDLWQHVQMMTLKINMRLFQVVHTEDALLQQDFANWLLQLGEGHLQIVEENEDIIKLPADIVLPSQDMQDLINFVYPDLPTQHNNASYLVG